RIAPTISAAAGLKSRATTRRRGREPERTAASTSSLYAVERGPSPDLRTYLRAVGEHADDLAHGRGGGLELGVLVVGQVELHDLAEAARAELHRDADVEAVDPVLTFEVGRAREDAPLVEHDRVDHLCGSRARRVPGRGAEQVDDLTAALGGALDH